MPIIDSHITTIINGTMISYYRDLRYDIPKIVKRKPHFLLKVKIEDLQKMSGQNVRVQCPYCNNIRSISYNNYNKSSDICASCFGIIQGKKNVGENNGQFGKRGKETSQYIDGRTKVYELIRKSVQYKEWRIITYKRDKFTCQCCDKVGSGLHCHHIISFSKLLEDNNITSDNWRNFYEILFNQDNGITMCKKCHKKLHAMNGGYKSRIGKVELLNFLKNVA